LLATRSQLQEQQAQQALEAQSQQETERDLELRHQQLRNHEQVNQRVNTSGANLVIHNKDCRAAYVYFNGQMLANLLPGQERSYLMPKGRYPLRICVAATTWCESELTLDTFRNQRVNYTSSKPGCN